MNCGTHALALHIYCPLLSHFLSAVAAVSNKTATGSCADLAKDSLKLCPLEYLFGLLKILPPCTWIKINQTKSALILALFQLHFGFFTVVPVLERKGSWGWNNNWKFRLLCVLEGKNVMGWRVGAACIFLKPKNVCSPSPVHWAPSQHGRAMGRERLAPWWHRWDRGWWPPGTCCCHLSGCTWHRPKAIFIAGLGGISITAP